MMSESKKNVAKTMTKPTIGLITFLKGSSNPADKMPGCANFDHCNGSCSFSDTCLVLEKKRCRYFEKSILPTAADIGQKERISKLYCKHLGFKPGYCHIEIRKIRKCPDCGDTELKPRQRYCDNCRNRRRLNSYRRRRGK
jgi:hypothetical protein